MYTWLWSPALLKVQKLWDTRRFLPRDGSPKTYDPRSLHSPTCGQEVFLCLWTCSSSMLTKSNFGRKELHLPWLTWVVSVVTVKVSTMFAATPLTPSVVDHHCIFDRAGCRVWSKHNGTCSYKHCVQSGGVDLPMACTTLYMILLIQYFLEYASIQWIPCMSRHFNIYTYTCISIYLPNYI